MDLLKYTLLIFWGGVLGLLSSKAEGGSWIFSLGACQEHVAMNKYASSDYNPLLLPFAFHDYGAELDTKYVAVSNNYVALTLEGGVCLGRYIYEPFSLHDQVDYSGFYGVEGWGGNATIGVGIYTSEKGIGLSTGIVVNHDHLKFKARNYDDGLRAWVFDEKKRQLLGFYARLRFAQTFEKSVNLYLGPGFMLYKRDLREKQVITLEHTSLHIGIAKEFDW